MCLKRKLNSSLGLVLALFCLCAVSCANIFQDKVAMSRSGSSATLGNLFVGKNKVEKLDAPSYVNVSVYEFNNRIRITWAPVRHAASYSLERAVVKEKTNGEWKEPDESEYEPLEHSYYIEGTSYVDTIITGSTDNPLDCENENYRYAFFYRVTAENSTFGYDSSEPTVSEAGTLLAPPFGTKATMGDSETEITITWNKTDGAVRYEIYRSQNEDGSNSSYLGQTLATTYKDNPPTAFSGMDLYYTVRAVGGYSGETSVEGSVALGYTLVKGAPAAAKNVMVVQGEGHGDKTNSIKIKFDPVSGENVKYTVYRSSSESATMKKLAELPSAGEYPDTKDLKENVYYYYYIQTSTEMTEGEGENAKKTVLKGPMSKSGPDDTSPAEGFILSKPSSVEVVKNRNKSDYTISFTPVIGDAKFATKPAKASYSNNYEYVVLGGKEQNGSFGGDAGKKNSSALTYNEESGKYSMDISPDYGFYKMKVVYNGAETDLTSVVAPSPYEAKNVYVTRAALVGEKYPNEDQVKAQYKPATDNSPTEPGSNKNGVHKVRITWETPEGGADCYEVYRSEKIGSGFKKISGDNPVTDLYYVDANESAKVGQIYYYKVLSLNELKQGANYSEIDPPELENNIIKTKNADGTPYGRGWGWGAITAWQYIHEMCKTVDRSHAKSKKLTTSSLTGKIGTENIPGDVNGRLDYNAKMDGIGGRAILHYYDYVDYYIGGNEALGYYFMLNGETNSSANASQNGTMDGTVECNGMYLGSVKYDKIEVKGGDSGGGYYILNRTGIDDGTLDVSYLAGKK